MAELAVATNRWPSMCSPEPAKDKFPSFIAGAAFTPGQTAYIHTDGKAYPATDNATTLGTIPGANKIRGQAVGYAQAGNPVTITQGLRFDYGDASTFTIGSEVYLSGSNTNVGGLATTPTTGSYKAIGYAYNDHCVQFYPLS